MRKVDCSCVGFDFIPFAFDTAGHLVKKAAAVMRPHSGGVGLLTLRLSGMKLYVDNFVVPKIGFTVMKDVVARRSQAVSPFVMVIHYNSNSTSEGQFKWSV